jgi:hypothetical protein
MKAARVFAGKTSLFHISEVPGLVVCPEAKIYENLSRFFLVPSA